MNKKSNLDQPLVTGLIKQNCYVRDVVTALDLATPSRELFYDTIDEVLSDDGLKHVRNQVPYEITPDYVNSFAESADYHNDPIGSILTSVKKTNLGDVTELQQINAMDDGQAQALYKQLQERFQKQAQAQAQAQVVSEDKNNVK